MELLLVQLILSERLNLNPFSDVWKTNIKRIADGISAAHLQIGLCKKKHFCRWKIAYKQRPLYHNLPLNRSSKQNRYLNRAEQFKSALC